MTPPQEEPMLPLRNPNAGHHVTSTDGLQALARLRTTIETTPKQPEEVVNTNSSCLLSARRRTESISDKPLDLVALGQLRPSDSTKTVLYLAYGSNLCNETFRGRRGIQPLSQINVLVPSLTMTFDLPGIPYAEPCFANTKVRPNTPSKEALEQADYHKNRWHKPLVGVVYEVTMKDYATIIATEGGGAGYKDIVVDCHPITTGADEPVEMTPSNTPFKAHTLFAPRKVPSMRSGSDLPVRNDPSYAQPSPRYKNLITTGAAECGLPTEYREYLDSIRPYVRTTWSQEAGLIVMLVIWGPLIGFMFLCQRLFKNKQGVSAPWVQAMGNSIFSGVWATYDNLFMSVFGDGERSLSDEDADAVLAKARSRPKRDYWLVKGDMEIIGYKCKFSV